VHFVTEEPAEMPHVYYPGQCLSVSLN